MGKVVAYDSGEVKDSLVQEFKGYAKTWIRYVSKIDSKQKVVIFDGVAHCKKNAKILVYYLATAIIVVLKGAAEWEEAIKVFGETYDLPFEDFRKMDRDELARLEENNPAALKDGQFWQKAEHLEKVNATKIWDRDDDVIWCKH